MNCEMMITITFIGSFTLGFMCFLFMDTFIENQDILRKVRKK